MPAGAGCSLRPPRSRLERADGPGDGSTEATVGGRVVALPAAALSRHT